MEVYLQGGISNRSPLGMIEGGEAGCCQGWDSCALVFVPVLLCHNQMHCCTSRKDWFYKPDLLPEAALGQLLWIYELSWVILFVLTDEMFRQMMGLRNLCTSGPADAQRLWQQHQLCSPEGENELQLVRGVLCLQWPTWHVPAHGQC